MPCIIDVFLIYQYIIHMHIYIYICKQVGSVESGAGRAHGLPPPRGHRRVRPGMGMLVLMYNMYAHSIICTIILTSLMYIYIYIRRS